MRNRNIRFFSLILTIIALAACSGFAQPLRETRQLTSNNIIALAGGGDTLWIATERGFNYRVSDNYKEEWYGFESNDLLHRLWGMAFGGGGAAALVNNSNDKAFEPIGFWHFNHTSGNQRERYFRFSESMRGENGDWPHPAGSTVYSHNSFWTPFNNAGIIRYNPDNNSVTAIRPGDGNEYFAQELNPAGPDENGKDTKSVLSLDVLRADGLILVTTPAALWSYEPVSKTWEILRNEPALAPAEEEFVSFNAAFVIINKETATLYSFMTVKRGDENLTALYGFDESSKQWFKAYGGHERFSVFPAVDGCVYTLFDGNRAKLLADTAGAVVDGKRYLSEIMADADFREMLASAGDDPNPEINDILFLSRGGSLGTLAVAAATGLYVWKTASPLEGVYDDFTLFRYVREVKRGEAYALPGVMRGGMDGRHDKSMFVYKLKKDGNVTIRVYDYNMSLVKTVVKGERRRSSAPRSTDPARDFWDGTNHAGKRVWPGVYYFKITSTGGDRFFGKVILAK